MKCKSDKQLFKMSWTVILFFFFFFFSIFYIRCLTTSFSKSPLQGQDNLLRAIHRIITVQLVPIKALQSWHAKFRVMNEDFETNLDCTMITKDLNFVYRLSHFNR